MIDLRTEGQLWAGRVSGEDRDLISVERELVAVVSERVRAYVPSQPHAGASPSRATDVDAHKLYLKGRHLWNRRDASGMRKAVECFREAVQRDPDLALAHAGIADALVTLGSRDVGPSGDFFPQARAAAERAMALDPELAAPLSAMGAVKELYEWDWNGALAFHERAVTLDRNYASAAQWYALHLARRARHDSARDVMQHALLLDPLSTIINTNAAFIEYLAGEYACALEAASRVIELEPHFEGGHAVAGVASLQLGDHARAVMELEEAVRLSGRQPYALANLACAFVASGDRAGAQKIEDELRSASFYVSPPILGLVRLALGDREGAIEQLERGVETRAAWSVYLLTEPRFAELRDEPRIGALIERIGYDRSEKLEVRS
jgi:tetratricopeptide (TPR) repeat protein